MVFLKISVIFLLALGVHSQENLFRNGDFEEPLDIGATTWFGSRCNLTRSSDAYTGQYSGKVTDRYVWLNYLLCTLITTSME